VSDAIYLDYNATTPAAPEVLETMDRVLREAWGNPSSNHVFGRRAHREVEQARGAVAELLACKDDEVVFTGGGTESDNAAIVGVAEARAGHGRHIVTSVVEHPAVEQACAYLEGRGWSVTRVPVDSSGRVDPEVCAAAFRADTVLLSVMHANNETGVLQPVRALAQRAHERGIVVHTDAAQSVGKIRVDIDELGVDLLTVAGHKLYGPQGVGALYLRRGTPFAGFLRGAAHEHGRRAGTENVAAIAGLGAACALAARELPARGEQMRDLRDRLQQGLRSLVPDLVVHGAAVDRLPNTLYVALPRARARDLLDRVPDVAMGTGAACHSDGAGPSSTLRAMGVSEELALCTLRLSVGRATSRGEIDDVVDRIGRAVHEVRGD